MSYAVDVGYSFTGLLGNVLTVAIKVVIFLAIVALGWLVAKWIRRALTAVLHRVGFDRAVERGGLRRMLGRYSASDVTAQLAMYAFMIFALHVAFGVFGPNTVSDLLARIIAWLPRLFVAIVIVVVAAAIAGWVKEIVSEALGGLNYGRALATAAQAVIVVLGVFAALGQIGVASSVLTPVLWAFLFAVTGVLVVGVGGGLVKPMQHRWERMLNRAETETTIAAERVRANRAARTGAGWDQNTPSGFQPAYGGAMTTDTKPPTTVAGVDYPQEQYADDPGYPPRAEER